MNPEMKNKVATFCGKVALSLGKKVGGYFKPAVDALVSNLAHQHSKVRKTTLRGLKDVLPCKGAEPFMDGATIAQLKFSMNDRSQDVRAEFYQVLFHWMTAMDIYWLRAYEEHFVQFLLNGIADDKLDIGPKCIRFLEDHGKRMQAALKALGDDEEMDAESEPSNTPIKDEKVIREEPMAQV